MDKQTVVISQLDGKYQLQNNGISEFALIGILECLLFNLKSAHRETPSAQPLELLIPAEKQEIVQEQKEAAREPDKKAAKESNSPDLRTRISNAIKAIKSLGGAAEDIDRTDSTEEELQAELEELTEQYKRLKSSKTVNK